MPVWNWIQRFGSLHVHKIKRISAFIIDEIVIQIGIPYFWLIMILYRTNSSFSTWNIHFEEEKYGYC
jgi:hypothetical protein